ncbi:hypothetical protein LZ31DRAFT_632960 [Colletotrichum somersetense]|nr:hypothetical protein LZ31DRAFT_632960 [Colletotrichum somersetense]
MPEHKHNPAAVLVVSGLPTLLLTLFFGCNDKTGCPFPAALSPSTLTLEKLETETPWPADGIWGLCSWKAMGWTLAYYFLSLVLYRVLPAQELLGTKLVESGRPLKYRFNSEPTGRPFCLPTDIAGYQILGARSVGSAVPGVFTMLDGRQVIQGAARGWGIVFTYFYLLYFGVLLVHREMRDDAACAEKYSKDWEEYKRLVRWRMLPGVY